MTFQKTSPFRLAALAVLVVAGGGAALVWSEGTGGQRSNVDRPRCEDGTPASARCEASDLSRSIAYLEDRYRADPWNHLVAGRLADRYMLRFRRSADLADLQRAEEVARATVRRLDDRDPGADAPVGAGRPARRAVPAAMLEGGESPSLERLRAGPAAPRARLSGILLARHRFAGAMRQARRAVAADSAEPSAWGALYDAAVASGRYALADSALAALPRGSGVHAFRQIRSLSARGHTRSARYEIRELCQRMETGPNRPQVVAWCLTIEADLAHQLHGPEAAESVLERALDVQPGYRGAVEGLAWLAYAREEWDRAAALYDRVAADAHPDIYLRLAEIEEARGRPAAARRRLADFHRALAHAEARGLDPERLYARAMAIRQLQWEDPGEAVAIMRREVERRPTVESWDLLAWALHRSGRQAEALAASDSATSRGDPGETVLFHRARILRALDRPSRSSRLEERARAKPTLLAPHVLRQLRRDTGRASPTG